MKNGIVNKYQKRFVSKWVILNIDLVLTAFLFIIAYLLRFFVSFSDLDFFSVFTQTAYITFLYFCSFAVLRTFEGTVRHTSLRDLVFLVNSTLLPSIIGIIISFSTNHFSNDAFFSVDVSVLIIHLVLNTFVLIVYRLLIKSIYQEWAMSLRDREIEETDRCRVLIYGAGESGLLAQHAIQNKGGMRYRVVGYIEDNPSKVGKKIQGSRVFSNKVALNRDFIKNKQINEIIFAIHNISSERRRHILDRCIELDVKVKCIPPLEEWFDGEFTPKQIRDVRIEDLLDRPSINLSNENIARETNGKRILVTGAAGSIGSEIVRQLLSFQVEKVILLDQAESPLFELQLEFVKDRITEKRFEVVVADITDRNRIEKVFRKFKPNIVFHAAAYKHVPMMEDNPYEAVKTNVGGTKLLSDLSISYKVDKFVMISTDKAVNPTNVMGATKRVAEIYTQTMNKRHEGNGTKFITTRFGNVLGSNGSVIPIFKRQIEMGGPVTVTSKDIIRYFMTIPEACQLVLEAGSMGLGGEIFVFDMGEPVRIYDVAKKMIKLSGFEIDKDIEIKISGLRPGEKLYEELLNNEENTLPTHHPKIMVGKVREYDSQKVVRLLEDFMEELDKDSNVKIVKGLKNIVPEFVSMNSIYAELD